MTIEHTLHIEAPPERVWAVTEDVERWPEWTPSVTRVDRLDPGPFGLGSRARIKQPMQRPAVWTVTAFEAGRRFVWEARQPGLAMQGGHEVIPTAGGTQSVLRVELQGWMATLLGPLLRVLVRRSLAAENEGLKARCEARSGST